MTDELKPVPCGCGGEAKVSKFYPYGKLAKYRVKCEKCGMLYSIGKYTKAEAVHAWNRAMSGSAEKSSVVERTAKVETYTDDQQETWSVCECGTDVWKSYNYCPECGAKLDWSE